MNGTFCIPFPGRFRARDAGSQRGAGCTRRRGGFLAGPENRLVEIAVEAVLLGRPSRFHPLVFYGPSGCGKSHLALGLAAEWRRRRPASSVLSCHAADFASDFAAAVEDSSVAEMRLRYESADLIVMEDLDHLAPKTAAQQELTALLDRIERRGAQAVLTTRHAPLTMPHLAPRLRSRLAGGLTVGIRFPECSTRMQLLEQFAAQRGVTLTPVAAQVLAAERKRNAWQLHGVVEQLQATLTGRTQWDRADVERLLHADAKPTLALSEIAKAAAKHYRHTLAELRSPSRRRTLVQARSAAMLLCRELAGTSLDAIGAYFGNRDHATVLHACRRTSQRFGSDPHFRQSLTTLRDKLQQHRAPL